MDNGWVTLKRTADNLKARTASKKLAKHSTGVSCVTKRFKVQWYDMHSPTDAEIKTEINMVLANNAITETWEINVTVNNGKNPSCR